MSSEMERLLLEEEQNYQEVYKGSRVKGTVEVIKPDSFYILKHGMRSKWATSLM